MIMLNTKLYDVEYDHLDCSLYTEENLAPLLFDDEVEENGDNYCIKTFDDMKATLDAITPEERAEYWGEDCVDYDICDWLYDCRGMIPIIKSIKRKER